jgi:hypothetical protein
VASDPAGPPPPPPNGAAAAPSPGAVVTVFPRRGGFISEGGPMPQRCGGGVVGPTPVHLIIPAAAPAPHLLIHGKVGSGDAVVARLLALARLWPAGGGPQTIVFFSFVLFCLLCISRLRARQSRSLPSLADTPHVLVFCRALYMTHGKIP